MKKEELYGTKWNLSKQTESERQEWLDTCLKLGFRLFSDTKKTLQYFFVYSGGDITGEKGDFDYFYDHKHKELQFHDLIPSKPELRLDFFLAQRLKLIEGDAVEYIHGTEFKITESPHLGDWNAVESCNKNYLIKSLAPRENKGVQAAGDDVVVDAVFEDGYELTCPASSLDWGFYMDRHHYRIKTWKPNLGALIELQEKTKVTQVKPDVAAYRLIEVGGIKLHQLASPTYTKTEMSINARRYGICTGVKSKFRPVYKKRDTHHSK